MRLAIWKRDVILAVLFVLAAGIVHRNALATPWADDRVLTADPAWFQMGAPFWHSTIAHSSSLPNHIVRIIDPLTRASTTGDARAIAAILTSLTVGALLMLMARAAVPTIIALLLSISMAAVLLPVSAAASLAHSLQMLLAAALLLAWWSTRLVGAARYGVFAAISLLGAANHAGFVACSAAIWLAEVSLAPRNSRARLTIAAVVTIGAAVFVAALMLQADIAAPPEIPIARPGIVDVGMAIVTGRFGGELQPQQQGTLRDALSLCLPAPLILCAPLALLSILNHETRRFAAACGVVSVPSLLFAAGTWLPDLAVAGAPARVGTLVVIALGLSALWREPHRWTRVVAIGVSGFVSITPLFSTARAGARAASVEMQAFVSAVQPQLATAMWSTDRLPAARALLTREEPAIRNKRVWSAVDVLRVVPDDQQVITIVGLDVPRARGDVWFVPYELPHPSAASFLDSQTESRWLALAVSGPAASGFCNALLDRLHIAEHDAAKGLSALVHLNTRAASTTQGRLEVRYGLEVGAERARAPASFIIESDPAARITVNGEVSPQTDTGMVVTIFDAWYGNSRSWVIEDCASAAAPSITDRRLRAAHVLEGHGASDLPRVPVIASTRVDVPLGTTGSEWFADGWHGPEAPGGELIRWTAAKDAHVNVLVSRRQGLRVRLGAGLAQRHPGSNTLAVAWNGTTVAASLGAGTHEWTIPPVLVRRGRNTLTLRVQELLSPALFGNPDDTRLLGAAVSHLSIEPTETATAAPSSTAPR